MSEKHENLLAAYFANQMSDIDRKEMLSLLETDPEFAQRFRELEEVYISACIPTFEKQKDKNFALIEKRIRGGKRRVSLWRPLAIAASLAVIALSGIALYTGSRFNELEQLVCSSENMIITAPDGSRTEAFLPDGTHVCLNAESTLRMDRRFGQNFRDIILEGEGYFEVAKDAEHPFRVHTGNTCVTVKGTTFNVRSYEDEKEIVVSLLEGSVALNAGNNEALLVPGKCAVVSRNNGSISIHTADPYASDWRNGKIIFTDKSIPEILRQIERTHGVRFVYDEKLWGDERFTGNISYHLSVDEILSYIDVDDKYKWSRNDDTIKISRK